MSFILNPNKICLNLLKLEILLRAELINNPIYNLVLFKFCKVFKYIFMLV